MTNFKKTIVWFKLTFSILEQPFVPSPIQNKSILNFCSNFTQEGVLSAKFNKTSVRLKISTQEYLFAPSFTKTKQFEGLD